MASMPRWFSLCPIPRTKVEPITATLGPVSPLPDVTVWPEPESDMGRLGIFDEGTRGRNGAGSLRVTADGVSRAGDDLVVLGRRRRPFETVWKPSLSLSPELNETINADTDLYTWSLSPCNSFFTLSVSGRLRPHGNLWYGILLVKFSWCIAVTPFSVHRYAGRVSWYQIFWQQHIRIIFRSLFFLSISVSKRLITFFSLEFSSRASVSWCFTAVRRVLPRRRTGTVGCVSLSEGELAPRGSDSSLGDFEDLFLTFRAKLFSSLFRFFVSFLPLSRDG